MGAHKKATRTCCAKGCGRHVVVGEGVEGTSGRYYCSAACAPVRGFASAGPVPDGHEDRILEYQRRAAAGLPLFDKTPRRRSA